MTGAKADLDIGVGADEDTGSGREQDNDDFQLHFSVTKHFRACDDDSNVPSQSRSETVELLAKATRKISQDEIIMRRDMNVAKGTPRGQSREVPRGQCRGGSIAKAVSEARGHHRDGCTASAW